MKTIIDFSESYMKKKFSGIKLSTVLSVILCLIFAILFWLIVKYTESEPRSAFAMITGGGLF